jgi:hypothetical protein
VRIDVSEERVTSIIIVKRIGELGTSLGVTSKLIVTANVVPSSLILYTLIIAATRSSETSILARVARSHIPEDGMHYVIFDVFTAVTMKNGIFCDVTPSGSCKNRRFGGT